MPGRGGGGAATDGGVGGACKGVTAPAGLGLEVAAAALAFSGAEPEGRTWRASGPMGEPGTGFASDPATAALPPEVPGPPAGEPGVTEPETLADGSVPSGAGITRCFTSAPT